VRRFQEENDRVWPTTTAAAASRLWQPSPDGLVGGPQQQPVDPPIAELAAYFSPAPGPGADDEAHGWSDLSDESGADEGPGGLEVVGQPRGTPPRNIAQLPPTSPVRSSWEQERAQRNLAVGDVISSEHEVAALDSELGKVRAPAGARLPRAVFATMLPQALPFAQALQ
jgi:hypothetical protein